MAKIQIESDNVPGGASDALVMDGNARELAALMVRAAATLIVRTKKPEKSLYDACITFGLSVYQTAADMLQKGQTHNGVYIEGASVK